MADEHRQLTSEAAALLRAADAGGVPMFTSANLRRIASENGVEVSNEMTPNDVIAALRARQTVPEPAPEQDVPPQTRKRPKPRRATRRRAAKSRRRF